MVKYILIVGFSLFSHFGQSALTETISIAPIFSVDDFANYIVIGKKCGSGDKYHIKNSDHFNSYNVRVEIKWREGIFWKTIERVYYLEKGGEWELGCDRLPNSSRISSFKVIKEIKFN